MPRPTETIRVPRHTDADADGAVRRHDFKQNIENRKNDGVAVELSRFDYTNKEDGEGDPPDIMPELAAELLPDEILVGPGVAGAFVVGVAAVHACDGAFDAVDELGAAGVDFGVGGGGVVGGLFGFVFGEDAERSFFVDVGVADCHCDGEGGDVHH